MTGRERFLQTLRFEQPDRPPHFQMVFELTEEAFGAKFPEWSAANAGACMIAVAQAALLGGYRCRQGSGVALEIRWGLAEP